MHGVVNFFSPWAPIQSVDQGVDCGPTVRLNWGFKLGVDSGPPYSDSIGLYSICLSAYHLYS